MLQSPVFCEQHGKVEPCSDCKKGNEARPPTGLISEREMWRFIYAALLSIANAIAKRYGFRKQS